MPEAEHVIVWSYRVEPGCEEKFLAAYREGGAWDRLFRNDPAYLGTQLVRCAEAGRYLTIDRWRSQAAFAAFLDAHEKAYDDLDDRCAELTSIEALIASGTVV